MVRCCRCHRPLRLTHTQLHYSPIHPFTLSYNTRLSTRCCPCPRCPACLLTTTAPLLPARHWTLRIHSRRLLSRHLSPCLHSRRPLSHRLRSHSSSVLSPPSLPALPSTLPLPPALPLPSPSSVLPVPSLTPPPSSPTRSAVTLFSCPSSPSPVAIHVTVQLRHSASPPDAALDAVPSTFTLSVVFPHPHPSPAPAPASTVSTPPLVLPTVSLSLPSASPPSPSPPLAVTTAHHVTVSGRRHPLTPLNVPRSQRMGHHCKRPHLERPQYRGTGASEDEDEDEEEEGRGGGVEQGERGREAGRHGHCGGLR
jgi:hypothetical protein